MRLLPVLALGGCAVALSGCGGSQSCPASLGGYGVGVSYSGFANNSKLTTQVCIKGVCHVSAPAKGDSGGWVPVGFSSSDLKGVQAISLTVRDATNRVVARDEAVSVHRLSVVDGCTTTIYTAALKITPGHIVAATRT